MPFVILSGCSGGGKSTLLAELGRRGHSIVEEAGRRIVREELASGGTVLPWLDLPAFIKRAISIGMDDYRSADPSRLTFFDRSMVDAWSARCAINSTPLPSALARDWPYHDVVFLTPPWKDLFATDGERQHSFVQAEAEYLRLRTDYPALGYTVVDIPRLPVTERADFILSRLS